MLTFSSGALRHALISGKRGRDNTDDDLQWARRRMGDLARHLRGRFHSSRDGMPAQGATDWSPSRGRQLYA